MKKFFYLVMIIPLGACSLFGYNAGVKEPPYTLLKQEKRFQLREYPSLILATTLSKGQFEKSQDESFQRLFDYISGDNTANKEIPMTAPVVIQQESADIPMTAPVLMEPMGNQGWKMYFVLPTDYTLKTTPKPKNSAIQIEERKNLKFAVITFSGFFNDSNFEKNKKTLEKWIKSQNFLISGPALRAGYNPPWTLPPLRRNEILIPIQ